MIYDGFSSSTSFGRKAPDAHLGLVNGRCTDQIAALFDCRLDLALVAGSVRENGGGHDNGIDSQPLWRTVPDRTDHPLANAAEASRRKIAEEYFLAHSWESGPLVFDDYKGVVARRCSS